MWSPMWSPLSLKGLMQQIGRADDNACLDKSDDYFILFSEK